MSGEMAKRLRARSSAPRRKRIIRCAANLLRARGHVRTLARGMTSARTVLRTPGVARTYGTSLIARLPMGAHALVLLLYVQSLTGSYALGGAAAGPFARAPALSAPPLGRLIDRHGQTRVLVPLALAQAAVHGALAAAPRTAA